MVNDEFEFAMDDPRKPRVGDVIVVIGETTKWVIVNVQENTVIFKELGVPSMPYLIGIRTCERDFLRISKWDFDLEREVDDGN